MSARLKTIRLMSILLTAAAAGVVSGCAESKSESAAAPAAAGSPSKACEGDAGIVVPAGFCASIFADNLGHARHLAVASTGDVYVNTWSNMYTMMKNAPGGYIVALRDADHDGRAEIVERFGTVHQERSTPRCTAAIRNTVCRSPCGSRAGRSPANGCRSQPRWGALRFRRCERCGELLMLAIPRRLQPHGSRTAECLPRCGNSVDNRCVFCGSPVRVKFILLSLPGGNRWCAQCACTFVRRFA
jgi:hypothetical protein